MAPFDKNQTGRSIQGKAKLVHDGIHQAIPNGAK